MDQQCEGLPDGTQVLREISSMDELENGKTYFNPQNRNLFIFLGKAISPDDLKVKLIWNEIDSASGNIMSGTDEQSFALPLVHVKLPDGFFKFERVPEA